MLVLYRSQFLAALVRLGPPHHSFCPTAIRIHRSRGNPDTAHGDMVLPCVLFEVILASDSGEHIQDSKKRWKDNASLPRCVSQRFPLNQGFGGSLSVELQIQYLQIHILYLLDMLPNSWCLPAGLRLLFHCSTENWLLWRQSGSTLTPPVSRFVAALVCKHRQSFPI